MTVANILMNVIMAPELTPKKPTLLVIDDEAGPRDALRVILRPFFNIQTAESASAAINVLNSQTIDLVTLDQKLPDRQGIELLHIIRFIELFMKFADFTVGF